MYDDRKTIFVVEEDPDLRGEICAYLAQHGFATATYPNTKKLHLALQRDQCDLILLDMAPPGGENSIALLHHLQPPRPKVIITSAVRDETSMIMGLELGADDYMAKPFSLREMLARVRTVLRRPNMVQDDQPCLSYRFEGWVMEIRTRLLKDPEGLSHNLSGVEFRLLKMFLEHPGQVVKRDDLAMAIGHNAASVGSRLLDVHISNLRSCLNDDGKGQRFIRTVWGDGYVFCAEVTKEFADGSVKVN